MVCSGWKLLGDVADLRFPPLVGSVELTTPAKGLGRLFWQGIPLVESSVLGVELPIKSVGSQQITDRYIRDDTSLVVSYASIQTWPIHTNLVWKVSWPRHEAKRVAILDCLISVSTDRLEGSPELTVRSQLASTEIRRLNRTGEFDPIGDSVKTVFSPVQGPSCTLFRLHGADYAQMVHPVDSCEDKLVVTPDEASRVELRHNLFRTVLEKGVILRARIRGVFLSERGDEASLVAQAFQSFASSQPPLSD